MYLNTWSQDGIIVCGGWGGDLMDEVCYQRWALRVEGFPQILLVFFATCMQVSSDLPTACSCKYAMPSLWWWSVELWNYEPKHTLCFLCSVQSLIFYHTKRKVPNDMAKSFLDILKNWWFKWDLQCMERLILCTANRSSMWPGVRKLVCSCLMNAVPQLSTKDSRFSGPSVMHKSCYIGLLTSSNG